MRRFRDLSGVKKAWFGFGAVALVALVSGIQWQLGGSNPILTQVLGAQAKKPDTTPPVVSIAFPVAGGVYGPNTWAGAVSGSASDASGVKSVQVTVDGNVSVASGTTSWSKALSLPAPGSHTVSVQATDDATPVTNTSSPVTVTFQIDTQAPATPTITQSPDNPTFDTTAHFAYTGEAGATFECQLDAAAPQSCSSSVDYKKLALSAHSFSVRAIDAAGNRGPAATYSWLVVDNKAFGISGSVTGTFSPGVSQSLNLVLANPYNFAIKVTGVTVTVGSATTRSTGGANPACDGNENLKVITQAPFTATNPVTIPGNGTYTLSGGERPVLQMPDLPKNQDACKNTTFKLSYTGTATK